jgi:hypothetical protein
MTHLPASIIAHAALAESHLDPVTHLLDIENVGDQIGRRDGE